MTWGRDRWGCAAQPRRVHGDQRHAHASRQPRRPRREVAIFALHSPDPYLHFNMNPRKDAQNLQVSYDEIGLI